MNSKNITDLSPSTFARKQREGKLRWTKLFSESINLLMNHKVSDRARALYLIIQPILGEHDGCLFDSNNSPHTPQSLSRCLYGRGYIEVDLQNLVRNGVLDQENGVIFCPFMVRESGIKRDDLVTIEGSSTSTYSDLHQCIRDQIVTIPLEKSENDRDRVEYSRVVLGSAPKTTTLTATEKKETGGLGTPVPFSGLTETDLDTVRAEYPNNFDKVYEKFVQYHLNKSSQNVNLKLLRGWFKRERQNVHVSENEEKEKINSQIYEKMEKKRIASLPSVKIAHDEYDNETYFIGGKKELDSDMFRQFEMMPKMTLFEAHKWLCKITKCEWNTTSFIKHFEDAVFFQRDDGEWSGEEYETPEEIKERLAEEKADKEEALRLKAEKQQSQQQVNRRREQEEKEVKRQAEKTRLESELMELVGFSYDEFKHEMQSRGFDNAEQIGAYKDPKDAAGARTTKQWRFDYICNCSM